MYRYITYPTSAGSWALSPPWCCCRQRRLRGPGSCRSWHQRGRLQQVGGGADQLPPGRQQARWRLLQLRDRIRLQVPAPPASPRSVSLCLLLLHRYLLLLLLLLLSSFFLSFFLFSFSFLSSFLFSLLF